jgi:hypothetical protein
VPPQDGTGSDDESLPGEALNRQRPGQQRQPRPIRPRQPHMSPRLLAQGDSQLVAQDQDLGILPRLSRSLMAGFAIACILVTEC